MVYYIKHTDEYGDWFMQRPGMWSDHASEAILIRSQAKAEQWAKEAEVRLNRHRADGEPRARVRVIPTKG